MSFATTYRPQTFDDVVEQSHIIGIVKQQLRQHYQDIQDYHQNGGAFPPAPNYLLYGPRGTGKTTTARLIAKGLNIDWQDGQPDFSHPHIELINSGQTMDVVEIDAASHTGVQNIRDEIIDKALYAPTQLTHKVYIIDEVHMLSTGAFNALLKIMEDKQSAPYLTFVLATTEIHKVPETIISRCHVFNFKKFPVASIVQRLQHICQKEGLTADEDALAMIAQLADGTLRDAIKYLDQVSVLGDVTRDNVSQFLGVTTTTQISSFVELFAAKDVAALLSFVSDLDQQGIDLIQFAKQVLHYADQHFSEDMNLYADLSRTMSQIFVESKYYPHPLLAYKVFLASLGQMGQVSSTSPKKVTATPSVATSASQRQEKTETKETAQITQSSEKAPLSSTHAGGDDVDKETLLAHVIDGLASASLQKLLANASITEVSQTAVTLVVLSKIAQMQLDKKDYREQVEAVLTQKCGRPMQLDVVYMTKEAFMQQQLMADL